MTAAPVTWTRESIRALLFNNPKAVYRAVLAIYARQTASEQAAATTLEQNGIGFNGSDALYFTRIVKRLQRRETIPAWEYRNIQRRIMKYSGQLLCIALEKQIEAIAAE